MRGTQYSFLRGFAAPFGGPYESVKSLLDTVQKRCLAQGASRSRVTAQQLGFIRRQVAGKEFTAPRLREDKSEATGMI